MVLLNPTGTSAGQPLGLSADESQLAYCARLGVNGDFQLYTKSISQLDPVPIRGARYSSENMPIFSPDGAWIAFGANGKLKKVPVAGGATLALCDASGVVGGTWLPDDSIVFASRGVAGLQRVPSAGGTPAVLTTPDGKTESAHRWPEALPGGKAVVFVIQRPGLDFSGAAIGVLRLDTREWRVLLEGGVAPHYLPSGPFTFVRNGVMMAAPFDLETLQVTGEPAPLFDGLTESGATGAVRFAVSRSGTVAYVPDGSARRNRALTWVDRTGTAQPLPNPHQPFEAPRLSPDGQQVAVGINNGASGGERSVRAGRPRQ